MNRIFLSLTLFFLGTNAIAQQVDWLVLNQVHYNMNPSMVHQTINVSANGSVISSRLDTSHVNYNQDVFGKTYIECRDNASNVLWNFILYDSAAVHFILTDSNNDIYIGGSFLGTINLDGIDTLSNNSAASFSENEFLLKLSSGGTLIWKRNASTTLFSPRITALACDQQNNLWYSTTDFIDSRIYKTNSVGGLVDSVLLNECKSVSSIVFDAFGSVYICGAASQGTMLINSAPFNVPETYMMYVARLNTNFVVQWLYFGHDITFQNPQLASDGSGGVYFAGNLMDSVTWGNITLPVPQWSSDFFLVRADSSGNFLWGRHSPVTPIITGRFSVHSFASGNPIGLFLTTDAASNAVLLGTINGTIDWGNGIVHTGTLGHEFIHVVTFDKSNTALWEKSGGGAGNYPTAISVSGVNEVYITAAIQDTCTFDSISLYSGTYLGCALLKIIPSSVGISEPTSKYLAVFPNPASSSVELPVEWFGKRIELVDLNGRVISVDKVTSQRLNIESIATGMYILRCENDYTRLSVVH